MTMVCTPRPSRATTAPMTSAMTMAPMRSVRTMAPLGRGRVTPLVLMTRHRSRLRATTVWVVMAPMTRRGPVRSSVWPARTAVAVTVVGVAATAELRC